MLFLISARGWCRIILEDFHGPPSARPARRRRASHSTESRQWTRRMCHLTCQCQWCWHTRVVLKTSWHSDSSLQCRVIHDDRVSLSVVVRQTSETVNILESQHQLNH